MSKPTKKHLETLAVSLMAGILTEFSVYLSDPEALKAVTLPIIGLIVLRSLIRLTIELAREA